MTVRARIGWTLVGIGLLTAVVVLVAVLLAFLRFDRESSYRRGHEFLGRVVGQHPELMQRQLRARDEVAAFLRNLVLYEPGARVYLLDADGQVLAASHEPVPARAVVPPAVLQASLGRAPGMGRYLMGPDPAGSAAPMLVAAQPLRSPAIAAGAVEGWLYFVCLPPMLDAARVAGFAGSLAQPGLLLVLCLLLGSTLLAAGVIANITRPLADLTAAVAAVSRDGLDRPMAAQASRALAHTHRRDEFGLLARGIDQMLATLRLQWTTLRRLDDFRREAVSNLSHDLRSPLTAATACLETLQNRWDDTAAREDLDLLAMALRNTRDAARLVQALGDLAHLDEPSFQLRRESMDVGELLADVAQRFGSRAQACGLTLQVGDADAPLAAAVDVELIERALANLLDNALKHCPAGTRVTLGAQLDGDTLVLRVCDDGPGIPASDLPRLFDRFYQRRAGDRGAGGEAGRGLGLAIVKRIAELHGGTARVDSVPDGGTCVSLLLPASANAASTTARQTERS